MKLFKKITSFTLVLAMLLGAQAAGLDINGFYVSSPGGSANKNHPGVTLQSIDTKQPNPDYVSLGNGILQRNSTQKVTVGLSLDMTSVSEAGLRYKLEGSEQLIMQSSSDIKNGYITFDIDVEPDASLGKYSLLDVQLKSKDGSALNSINLKEMAVSYEVVGDKSAASASVKETGEPESAKISETSAVVGVDGNSSITGEDIGKAIDISKKAMKNEAAQPAAFSSQGSGANTVIAAEGVTIVLDPGHGGSEPGAVSGAYLEKNLNLKIAQYAKAELETYAGVTVGMTRMEDTYMPLAATRADAAQQQGADILVSIHNNSAGNEATGAEVFVSVLNAYNQASTALGNLILDQLTMLGLYDRGVKTRSSEDGTIFTLTGELADYYGIIRESAYRGFPGIIIEHCFMSNPAEAQAYLSSDAKLKQLGVADAKALADYYGLVKKDATATSVNLSAGKPFISPVFTDLSCMTDGSRSTNSFSEDYPAGGGLQYVQMDLGAFYDLSDIKLWHYFGDGRKYKDVIAQVSSDPAFAADVTTVYNNDTDNSSGLGAGTDAEYAETSLGHSIQFDKVNARYVRLYSNGSSVNSSNHYVEVEIYGLAHPASVSLSKTSMNLEAGAEDTLTASVMPLNTTYNNVAWSSSDESTATVSPAGVVTGVTEGTAVITATTVDGGQEAACEVRVTAVPKNLSAGKIFTSTVFKDLGSITDGSRSTGAFADDYPSGGGLQYVQMDLGAYYDLSKIRLWHYYGDGRKYNDVIVRVSNDPTFASDVTTVYSNDGDNSAGFGIGADAAYSETSAGLTIKIDMVNARYVRLYSNGSDKNTSNHYVEAEVYGFDGPVVHPAELTLDKGTAALEVGETTALTAKIMPLNTTDKSVAWSSSDESTATVSPDGVVTGVKEGMAVITATAVDGGLKAECEVRVTGIAKNLSAGKIFTSTVFKDLGSITDGSKSTGAFADDYPSGGGLQYVQMDLGAYYDLSKIRLWHYYGDGRKYNDVIVRVSNDPTFASDVTTVYSNDGDNSACFGIGADAAYSETSAGLTIKIDMVNARYVRLYSNGSDKNTSNHYVEAEVYGFDGPVVHPAELTLNKGTAALEVGETAALTAKVMPLNTTDKRVTWSSSNTSVATVSGTGTVTVTGVKAGTATITATAVDGGQEAACVVKVTAVPKNLSAGRLFTSSVFKDLASITDGSKSTGAFADDYPSGGGLQYVQMDLGSYCDLSRIKLWHYYGDGRKYNDVIVRVSNDPAFVADVTTVYSNDGDNSAGFGAGTDAEYSETSAGLTIPIDMVNARYVRLYSNGSDKNASNHYVEAEIYGFANELIMGAQAATAEQMAEYSLSKNPSPKINCTMLELAQMFLEEGKIEGVRGDIAFAQACKETGYFAYGGTALPEWNNYCGLGVTGVAYDPATATETQFTSGVIVIKDSRGNNVGTKFSEPRLGVRAQIQHLKGYATSAPLKQALVDPRYSLISKGIAPKWADLNGRWAVPGTNYGQDILRIYELITLVAAP